MNLDEINKMYEEIADELNIPDAVLENAERSYKALGEYIQNHLDGVEVVFFPQGSMNLGTIIKPISDDDDYDLDAVCKLKYKYNNPSELKNTIGDILKDSKRYKEMLQEEGKRCWTLKYYESSHFHMDILPCMPGDKSDKSIIITHKENGKYEYRISNPEGYFEWFNRLQEQERRRIYESRSVAFSNSIEDLRKYKIRTTLQKTIQIIKRHRDMIYKDATDSERKNKPISIIITTLVGRMYTGGETILELLTKFVNNYEDYMELDESGNYVIKNPVNEEENFADKWIIYPERKKAFFRWISQLKKDLITNNYMTINGMIEKADYLKGIFGSNIVSNVYEKRAKKLEKKYTDSSAMATLTSKKTDIENKPHHFYGSEHF